MSDAPGYPVDNQTPEETSLRGRASVWQIVSQARFEAHQLVQQTAFNFYPTAASADHILNIMQQWRGLLQTHKICADALYASRGVSDYLICVNFELQSLDGFCEWVRSVKFDLNAPAPMLAPAPPPISQTHPWSAPPAQPGPMGIAGPAQGPSPSFQQRMADFDKLDAQRLREFNSWQQNLQSETLTRGWKSAEQRSNAVGGLLGPGGTSG